MRKVGTMVYEDTVAVAAMPEVTDTSGHYRIRAQLELVDSQGKYRRRRIHVEYGYGEIAEARRAIQTVRGANSSVQIIGEFSIQL